MSFVADLLRRRLDAHLAQASHWCVALSGGIDSSVLLHGMCALRAERPSISLRAIHINHRLHAEAGAWSAHCEKLCRDLGVPLEVVEVVVDPAHPDGPEAAARAARYAAFEQRIAAGENLLTAHHQDDQVETVLLRLLRGAGPRGLAGIAGERGFGRGRLVRPLLDMSRAAIVEAAADAGLEWIEDASNEDTSIDRNFLRHRVAPLLRDRWPGMGRTIGRAARLSGEAADLLDALAELDARDICAGDSIDLNGLRALDSARQRNLVRHVLHRRGHPAPSEVQLGEGLEQLLFARPDRSPAVHWGAVYAHRYRDRVYLLDFDPQGTGDAFPERYDWDGTELCEMGPVRGRLRLIEAAGRGIAAATAEGGMVVRFRHGGERIRGQQHEHHKSLKKLFQERGVLPWMRPHVPLLYRRSPDIAGGGDQLLAVGDLWVAADAAAGPAESGYRVVWEHHAATF